MMVSDSVGDYSIEDIHRCMYKACQFDHFRHWPESHRIQLKGIFLAEQPDGSLADMARWLIARSADVSTYVD